MGIIPFDKLVYDAELIVEGTVLSVGLARKNSGNSLATTQHPEYVGLSVAELVVERTIKGEGVPPRISIQFSIGEDSPSYKPGEHVVAFLRQGPAGERYITVGMMQGKYLIREGMVERPNVSVGEFLRRIGDLIGAPRGGG